MVYSSRTQSCWRFFRVKRLCHCLVYWVSCVAFGYCSALQADEPKQVNVGMYLNDIPTASLKENYFVADFYVWFRWTDPSIQPHESFSVMNGVIQSKEISFEESTSESHYVVMRVLARVTQFWDISCFPFDNHTLNIAVEDEANEDHKLVYIADTPNTAMSPEVRIPGWELSTPTCEILQQSYNTNYGNLSLPTGHRSTYSRFQLSAGIFRSGNGYFWKLFAGMYVAVMIALLALFIKPTDLDPRFGLGVGSIFAAVASEYIVSGSLPDTNVTTTADTLHIIAFFTIFLSLVESTVSLRLIHNSQPGFAQRLDRVSFFVIAMAYTGLNYWVIHH